jgi:putative membrane-bound dehydrogenase-like protein
MRIAAICLVAAWGFGAPILFAQEEDLAKELPRLPPVAAGDAAATITVQRGFRMGLVAAEPLVSDPVDACFDADGNLFVAEMHGYPYSFEKRAHMPEGGGKKDAGVIRKLIDTNDDGAFDESHVFAKDISWPTSVCCYRGGLFVLAPEKLYYFKDTTGDHQADVREVVYSGFSRANVQGVANNMKWGLDHQIHTAVGSNGADLHHRGKALLKLGRLDFSFDPRTERVTPLSGGVQFGNSLDDWGHRFVCSNSNHMMHVVFPLRYLERNPALSTSGNVRSIAKEGGAAPVFRTSPAEPWRIVRTRRRANDPKYAQRLPATELVAVGFFTSATSVTIYRGDAYPEEYRGNAFIGDVGGNLIHRKTLAPNGASFIATRADRDVEFVTSTDTWFRPANFVNAPDGTLYVLDMYRETIEHPVSIPEDIKSHLDLESGHDRGRIWRLEPPGFERRSTPRLGQLQSVDLVRHLSSPNAWHRETAHRLIWERQDKSVVPLLRAMLRTNDAPLARLHALWSLKGLDALELADCAAGIQDSHPEVQAATIAVSEEWAAINSELRGLILDSADTSREPVLTQLLLSLGEWKTSDAAEALYRLNPLCKNNDLRTAWLSSIPAHAPQVLQVALEQSPPATGGLVGETARTLGILGSEYDLQAAIDAMTVSQVPLASRISLLTALGSGLKLRGKSLVKVAASGQSRDLEGRLEQFFAETAARARNKELRDADRVAAVNALAYADSDRGLIDLLEPSVPAPIQSAAVSALSNSGGTPAAEAYLDRFEGMSPALKRQVIDELLKRKEWTGLLLGRIAAGKLKTVELPREQKDILLNHPDKSLQAEARKLLQSDVAGDRAEVIGRYRPALANAGEPSRGAKLFEKHCLACHQVSGQGHKVGPDLTSVKNKSEDDLLIAILDPSREAQSNFISYTVVTDEGKVLTGIISAESSSAITLLRAEGKEDVILRNQIETLKSNGISLMPDGMEKELQPGEMADLIAYIKTITGDPE